MIIEKNKFRSYIRKLEKFNKIIDELTKESRFLKWLKKHTLGFKASLSNKIKFRLPDDERVRAFVTPLRAFIQESSDINVNKIKDIYDKLPLNNSLKKEFYYLRDSLNKYLGSKSEFPVLSNRMEKPTNQEMFNTIIYARYIHYDEQRETKLKVWTQEGCWEGFIMIRFFRLIYYTYLYLLDIQKINKRTIRKLKKLYYPLPSYSLIIPPKS